MLQRRRIGRLARESDPGSQGKQQQPHSGRRVSWGHEDTDGKRTLKVELQSEVSRRAFSRVDALVLVVLLLIGAGLLLPAMTPRRCRSTRQLKDSTQIRGIMQSYIVWAGSNNDRYPLPSAYDLADRTVGERGVEKNTTANTLSMLIFNSAISPELCISPAEVSQHVQQSEGYEYSSPKAAALPSEGLWDPAFRATPMDPERVLGVGVPNINGAKLRPSNQSYAFALPIGKRLNAWTITYSETAPILGNRGPTYAKDDFAPRPTDRRWKLVEGELGAESQTLHIHGGRTTWEGNIAFADGHVSFETKPDPDRVTYRGTHSGKPVPDNLFVNESDEHDGDLAPGTFARGQNAYLRAIHRITADGKAGVWRD